MWLMLALYFNQCICRMEYATPAIKINAEIYTQHVD